MSITSYFFQVQTSWTWRVLVICLWVCRSLHREKDLHYLEVLDLPCYQLVSSSQVILKIDSRTWKWLVHPKTLTVISWNHYLTRLADWTTYHVPGPEEWTLFWLLCMEFCLLHCFKEGLSQGFGSVLTQNAYECLLCDLRLIVDSSCHPLLPLEVTHWTSRHVPQGSILCCTNHPSWKYAV